MLDRRQFVGSAVAGLVGALAAPALAIEAGPGPVGDGQAVQEPVGTDGFAPKGTIDWHNHWISPRAADILKGVHAGPYVAGGLPGTGQGPSGQGPQAPRPMSTMLVTAEERIAHLDQTGVQRQVISWATTMGWDAVLKPEQAKPLWSAFNEDLSGLVKAHPDRLSGYAVVPTSDIGWAVKEIDRAYNDLGLIGVVLPVGAFQTLEGAKNLTPIFEVSQEHKGIVYIHSGPAYHTIPGQRPITTPASDIGRVRGRLEFPTTYGRGVITLTQTGFLDPYPDVTVQVAMLGGLSPLLLSVAAAQAEEEGLPSPIEKLRRIYLDASTSRYSGTLELAARTIGPDRILFGTDFGAVNNLAPIVSAVHGSGLSDREKQLVFVENGQKLFREKGRQAA